MSTKKQHTEETAPAAAPLTADALANAFDKLGDRLADVVAGNRQHNADILEEQRKLAPIRAISTEELYRRNPSDRPYKFPRPTLQNGGKVNPHGMSDATRKKLNALTPGTGYLRGLVDVIGLGDGGINIVYDNAERAQQNALIHAGFTSFAKLVDLIYEAQNNE